MSVHPGVIMTELVRHIENDDMGSEMLSDPVFKSLLKSPEQGAATSVWAAIAKEWEGKGGRYLNARWEGVQSGLCGARVRRAGGGENVEGLFKNGGC